MFGKSTYTVAVPAAILLAALTAAPAASAQGIALNHTDASLYVVHGLPGQDLGVEPGAPLDVLLDGEDCALRGIVFGEVAGPLSLEPGVHAIRITHADPKNPCSDDAGVLVDDDFAFETGDDLSLVAHLDEAGSVSATIFLDDFSRVDPSGARLIVHHTAALPAVDITVRREAPDSPGLVFLGATNGERFPSEMRWGAWGLFLGLASTDETLYEPVTALLLRPFTANLIYVVGSESNDTLTLISNRVYLRFKARGIRPELAPPGPRVPGLFRPRPN